MKSIKAKLKKPASVVSGSKEDWTKLDQRIWHSVAVNQPAKLAAKLSKHDSVNVNKLCPSVGYSVVHYAAAKGLDDCLNVLLAHKANVGTRDVTGSTPLHASARYGHKGTTTKLLASRTVDVNARDVNSCTALHFAAFEGHLDCVKLIADQKRADIHCVDKEGRTALMVAAAMGRLNVCAELIKRKIDVNHHDSSDLQHTALTIAAEAGHADVVRLLCENGAEYAVKLSDGRNALDVARARSRKSVIDALHIMQLTEAAKKTDRSARLSTGSKVPSDKTDAKLEKMSKSKSMPDASLPFVDEHVPSASRPQEVFRDQPQKSAAESSQSNSVVLSMYNDTKNLSNLYERDISMYDSKSTLASVSSLDIANDSSRSHIVESSHSPPQAPSSDHGRQNVAKLMDELAVKEKIIASLQEQIKDFTSTKAELENLRMACKKSDITIKGLEKEHKSVSSDYQKMREANEMLVTRIHEMQSEIEKSKQREEKLNERAREREESVRRSQAQVSKLNEQNASLLESQSKDHEDSDRLTTLMKQTLIEVGKTCPSEDCHEIFDELRSQLLEAYKANKQTVKKKDQAEEDRRSLAFEELQGKVNDREVEVQELKQKLVNSEASLKKSNDECSKLIVTLRSATKRIEELESINEEQSLAIRNLNVDLSRYKKDVSEHVDNMTLISDLQEKLTWLSDTNMRLENELKLQSAKIVEEQGKFSLALNNEVKQGNECKQAAADLEKVVGELRVERNQREARIAQLEKEMQTSEKLRNECKVESNRARQELTEYKQKYSSMQDEIVGLRKSKKDLSAKLSAAKLYECTDVERKKIDSMKKQLEQLCKHIQESEAKYNKTIAVYRSHLLKAAKGELNPEVLLALKEIVKLRDEPHSSNNV